jgi:hypothetical protein
MKEALQYIGKMLGSLALILVAGSLLLILTPFAFLWLVYNSIHQDKRKARGILKGMAAYFIALASSLDKLGNCAFGGFFNWLLLEDGCHPFGQGHETVSEVLGWGEYHGDLTRTGKMLLAVLNVIQKDHCFLAMHIGLEKARLKALKGKNIESLK